MSMNVLVFGAHPDDADLGVGGILAKLGAADYKVCIADLTAGEMASRGTVEERQKEAQEAAERLGVETRVCLELPDGNVANVESQRQQVLACIRQFQPTYIIAPMTPDRHPDHGAAHALIRDANFLAGLPKIETGHPPHRANRLFYYHPYHSIGEAPTFVVDISETYTQKVDALKAFASQLHNPNYAGAETYVSSKAFWEAIEIRARYWGQRIGVVYGEPLYTDLPLGVNLPWLT